MTPNERERYFKKVRTHATTLIDLLKRTRYDMPSGEKLLIDSDDDELSIQVELAILDSDWGDDFALIRAYKLTTAFVAEMPYTYPESHLTELLRGVLEWTDEDDEWGWDFRSSAPIGQAHTASTRVIYFNCTLYKMAQIFGLKIPFPILCTIANVALELPPDGQVDEDTVRKQVTRYEAKLEEMNRTKTE